MKLELTKREITALRKVAQHITSDIEVMGDKSEPADQRKRAKDLEEGRAVILKLLRIVTPTLKVGAGDTAKHVCGLQGFGQADDVCPACVRPNSSSRMRAAIATATSSGKRQPASATAFIAICLNVSISILLITTPAARILQPPLRYR